MQKSIWGYRHIATDKGFFSLTGLLASYYNSSRKRRKNIHERRKGVSVLYQTILIAEDDADIIELLSLYLSGEGYHILSAENGRQALELMRTEKISLAIVDIMLPEINGYDLIRKIRETQNFPIIILSICHKIFILF